MRNVIVIAGTGDSKEIIESLTSLKVGVVATVATGYGSETLRGYEGITVLEGPLDKDGMKSIIKEYMPLCLIDASHPFAREVTRNAIDACGQMDLPYLRFDRKGIEEYGEDIVRVKSFEEAAKEAAKHRGNILLTIGSNNIMTFTNTIPDYKNRLFARVLPQSAILSKCECAGLGPDNIIAMKGPFSEELNAETLKHVSAKVLVTKDSGDRGGTAEKIKAAQSLGIKVIMVEKPRIENIDSTGDIYGVGEFVKKLNKEN